MALNGRNELTSYRRHGAACSLSEPTYFPATKRARMRDTCACPIVVSGYLLHEPERVRHLSLGTNDWTQAEIVKADLLKRQRIAEAQAKPSAGEITIGHAINRFITAKGGKSLKPIEAATLHKYDVLLKSRLVPFAKEHGYTSIRILEDFEVVSKFTESWVNLLSSEKESLGINTKRAELQRLRAFSGFCKKHKWIAENEAKNVPVRSANDEDDNETKRHGLELAEYERVLDMIDLYPDVRAAELRALVELMRWTGMRISDAVKFNHAEIVRDTTGDGWNADFIQKKTSKRCVSPIPDHVVMMFHALPFKGERAGKRYWFWTGVGGQDTAITNWRADIQKLFEQTQDKMDGILKRPFTHHVTPHCLRHTFAIQHLNAGTDVKFVSEWLGHESIAVTLKHYRNSIRSTKLIAENASREAVAKMRLQIELMKKPAKVVTFKRSKRA